MTARTGHCLEAAVESGRRTIKAYAIKDSVSGRWVVPSRQKSPLLVDTVDVRCLQTAKSARSYLRRRRGAPGEADDLMLVEINMTISNSERVYLPEEL